MCNLKSSIPLKAACSLLEVVLTRGNLRSHSGSTLLHSQLAVEQTALPCHLLSFYRYQGYLQPRPGLTLAGVRQIGATSPVCWPCAKCGTTLGAGDAASPWGSYICLGDLRMPLSATGQRQEQEQPAGIPQASPGFSFSLRAESKWWE